MNAKKLVMLLAVVAIAVGVWFMMGSKGPDCDSCYEMVEVTNEDGTITMERGDVKEGCTCLEEADTDTYSSSSKCSSSSNSQITYYKVLQEFSTIRTLTVVNLFVNIAILYNL
mgnify:CR=1 FL=1